MVYGKTWSDYFLRGIKFFATNKVLAFSVGDKMVHGS